MTRADAHEFARGLLHVAHLVREQLAIDNAPLKLRDVYALCYYTAQELRGSHSDVLIMIGDRETEHGKVQHHWLEFPESGYYLDPAYDEFDPFQSVRVGLISDESFTSTYRNGLDSGFSLDDPRDRPEIVYRPRTAFDPETGPE
jgi:hypothetical protein